MHKLLDKIKNKEAVIGIIGLGYVGIPLASRTSSVGFKVIGFDVDTDRVNGLNKAKSPIKHIPDLELQEMLDNGFIATTDFAKVAECDSLIICVPTPLNKAREPDLGFVIKTMETMKPYFREEQLVSLESTTWPGTTREILLPFVEAAGFDVGENFYLVYSPEREDPGNVNFTTQTIPKVVGGFTEKCLETGSELYGNLVDKVVPVSSTDAAEMVKLMENIHRSVNIGLANEMKIVTDAMGLDIFEITDAAKTKPFGFTAYYPGPGIGGHCIPIDPFYLTWKAHEFGVHTRFIELAGEINAAMPKYVVSKAVQALNKAGKSLNGSKVLALGISYKRDVDDMRESPSVHVMELLREWGAEVHYSDSNVPTFPKMREHQFDLSSVKISPEVLSSYDMVILLTDHSSFDYDTIEKHSAILLDTRGKFEQKSNVFKA